MERVEADVSQRREWRENSRSRGKNEDGSPLYAFVVEQPAGMAERPASGAVIQVHRRHYIAAGNTRFWNCVGRFGATAPRARTANDDSIVVN